MRRWQKAVTTLWSSLLAAPLLWACYAFWQMECGEIDPCPTGGSMPFAPAAATGFFAILISQACFLFIIWKTVPEREE